MEVDVEKVDPLDFALWKAAKPGEPVWDSPWGPGRPGWHIECVAMATDLLGETFDIHGGGDDLAFPHHQNEVAEAEGADLGFARHWIHGAMLNVNGEKMAKSLGNFTTLSDLLDRLRAPSAAVADAANPLPHGHGVERRRPNRSSRGAGPAAGLASSGSRCWPGTSGNA